MHQEVSGDSISGFIASRRSNLITLVSDDGALVKGLCLSGRGTRALRVPAQGSSLACPLASSVESVYRNTRPSTSYGPLSDSTSYVPRVQVKVRAYELRGKSQKELVKQLEDLKKELSQLRVSKVSGAPASKVGRITQVRKGIARVLTVYTQKQKEEARAAFRGKKFIPLDLRGKKTRAMRRRMTFSQSRKMTVR